MAEEKNEFNPFADHRPLTTSDLPDIANYVKDKNKSSSSSSSRKSSSSKSKTGAKK